MKRRTKEGKNIAIRSQGRTNECLCYPAEFLFITEKRIEKIRSRATS